ncbi:hypothetical protein M758_10G100800 [Ceratodon purpureus]|nr:hypothetical protein M758_10G100800 [Ceratodon purpureus]
MFCLASAIGDLKKVPCCPFDLFLSVVIRFFIFPNLFPLRVSTQKSNYISLEKYMLLFYTEWLWS